MDHVWQWLFSVTRYVPDKPGGQIFVEQNQQKKKMNHRKNHQLQET